MVQDQGGRISMSRFDPHGAGAIATAPKRPIQAIMLASGWRRVLIALAAGAASNLVSNLVGADRWVANTTSDP